MAVIGPSRLSAEFIGRILLLLSSHSNSFEVPVISVGLNVSNNNIPSLEDCSKSVSLKFRITSLALDSFLKIHFQAPKSKIFLKVKLESSSDPLKKNQSNFNIVFQTTLCYRT